MRVGDEVTPFVRRGTFEAWARFAAVNDEFAAHHMDDEVARREGFAAAFAMAPLTSSYVHAMLRDWLDAVAPGRGRIDGVQVRLRHPFLRGRTLTVAGTVVAVDGERITVEVRADDDHGARVAEGEAVVVVRAG